MKRIKRHDVKVEMEQMGRRRRGKKRNARGEEQSKANMKKSGMKIRKQKEFDVYISPPYFQGSKN
jgi:hypothetical protein